MILFELTDDCLGLGRVCYFSGVYPGFTQLEWYNMIYPNLTPRQKPLECVQEAGEIIYLVSA